MNSFLKETRKLLRKENICIIIGNESCDLDSVVSSISLAYYYYKNPKLMPISKQNCCPILNIRKEEFPIKTEVTYYLKINNIDINNLIFREELDLEFIQKNNIILVDHHVSPFNKLTVAVFDHRPFDKTSNLPNDCCKTIEQVGSCATLIASLYLKLCNNKQYLLPLKLLYGAIVLDTVNFSKEAKKATELDHETAKKIENLLEITDLQRNQLFIDLVNARSNIDTLDSYQLLFKDMKIIMNDKKTKRISINGFPISVREYLKRENSFENIKKFANSENYNVVILMGMKIIGSTIERDLLIMNIDSKDLYEEIYITLLNSQVPNLNLIEINDCTSIECKLFEQKNITISRKQILPLVKEILQKFN